MTKTSSFGTSKRERHDASHFYSRNLYAELAKTCNGNGSGAVELDPVDIGRWADTVYPTTSEHMEDVPDNSIGLAFTSPPYNVGKDYDKDMGLDEYLGLIRNVGAETYRVLRPGGRYVINVANLGRKPYIPLHSLFHEMHRDIGFLTMGEIIWQKGRGASNSCAWGSWLSAKAPRHRDIHEYLLVFAKHDYSRPERGTSTIDRDEFMAATLSIWGIPPESARRVGHPAPFPLALAERVIHLYSYLEDVVLDPFVGSGTTCVAAKGLGRHYVGFDISPEYVDRANARIAAVGWGERLEQQAPLFTGK